MHLHKHHHACKGIVQYHYRGMRSHRHPHKAHRSNFCTMASRDGLNDTPVPKASAEAWEALEAQMQVIRGGTAKGLALEELKASVDQLDPFAAPDDLRFGEACLGIAQSYASADEEPTEFLHYAQRALKAYVSHKGSSEHARCLYLLGYTYFKMEKYQSAIMHLEECSVILKEMPETIRDEYCDGLEPEVQALMGQAKMILAKPLEALTHYQNLIDLKEKSLEAGHPELGPAYMQAAHAFRGAKDLDAAMRFSCKALEVYKDCYGASSPEVAEAKSLMSALYCDLGKYTDSLLEYEAARPILEQIGHMEEVAYLDLSSAESLIHLERYTEAVARLEDVIQDTELTSAFHFNALIMAARAYAALEKKDCILDCCKKALDVLERQEASTETATDLALLALFYEEQKEFKQAAMVLMKAKKVLQELGQSLEHPPAFVVADLEGKIGFLLLRINEVTEAIPFLENSLLHKESTDAQDVLRAQFYLGAAYLQAKKLQEALQQFEGAKRLLSESVEEVDASMIIALHDNLASLYRSCGRFDEAIESQKVAVNAMKKVKVMEPDFDLGGVVTRLEAYLRDKES